MIKFFKKNYLLILIVLLASILRLTNLNLYPASLNWDEISHGYNAFSILKNGTDEWGEKLPLIFRAYGDYKLPVYIYLTVISEFIFGLNEFAVRFPSALSGILLVVFTYLLTFELFKKQKDLFLKPKTMALFASFLVAVEPWTFFISRPAFEANLGLLFFVSGVYFFLKYLNKSDNSIIYSVVLFGLSAWTYNSYRIFTPLFIGALSFIFWKKLKKNYLVQKKLITVSFILLFIFFVPMFYQLFNSDGSARYQKVAILDQGAINKINDLQSKYPRVVANKVTYFAMEFGKNYMAYLSPSFLFFKGGTQYQFSVQNHGLIYLVNLPFFYVGIFYLLKTIKLKHSKVILAWLLLSPVAGSLTREAPHVLRSVTLLPIPMILSVLGFCYVLNLVSIKYKNIFKITYLVLMLILILIYLNNYFYKYNTSYSQSWQYGYKEVALFLMENDENYAKIIINKKYGEAHEFILFYSGFDPARYLNDKNLNRFNQSDWWWVDGFDKYYFVNDWQIPKDGYKFIQESKKVVDCRQAKCLLVTSPNNAPLNWNKIKTINFVDGSPAFELYENN